MAGHQVRHLHVRREARQRFALATGAFGVTGRLVEVEFAEAERLAALLTRERQESVTAGTVAAGALLHELAHLLIAAHPAAAAEVTQALQALPAGAGAATALELFVDEFPPPAVAVGILTPTAYIRDHYQPAWEELLLLSLADRNPAYRTLANLFELGDLKDGAGFTAVLTAIETALSASASEPARGDPASVTAVGGVSLLELLLAPQRRHPESLADQLATAMREWAPLLGFDPSRLWRQARMVLGVLAEEERHFASSLPGAGGGGVGREAVGGWGAPGDGISRYSSDHEWMRRTVMVAKNAFVWLAQLSREHSRSITRLDEVPDEALDGLVADGINALWLIGIWQRSRASRAIKRLRGQSDAEASAYAIDDYDVAVELGSEAALQNLKRRAAMRGLRLASDMVPNHTGIDGRWVIEHPERFIQVDRPPYLAYTFSGPNLSGDARAEIRIEDGYYHHTDAAVVFERRDPFSGERRYIYHGNDGTAMPWNDTAQLDFLDPGVREAVIQQILDVCRRFPIVRFDAAMTLAKRHIKRLWHPSPGVNDGVPSRSRYAVPEEEFEARMPREFWREVVERAAVEAPDTLLLAEAFWMLEGFFVRDLGMHRVYNSAFMHMLANEDNRRYRDILRSTLASDPRVLERFVNYLSNPDEESTAETFGTGDKELAATVMLATMPGLPLLAHGQVEGMREKYGMEFSAPRLWEEPNAGHRERHRRVIAPLLTRRALFASALGFVLYDVAPLGGPHGADGVFAYGNTHAGESALVVVNNSPHPAQVRVDHGVRGRLPESAAGPGVTVVRLAAEVAPGHPAAHWLVAREAVSGSETVWPLAEVEAGGLSLELAGYQALVFWDFQVHEHPPAARGQPALEPPADSGRLRVAALPRSLRQRPRALLAGARPRAAAVQRRRRRTRR